MEICPHLGSHWDADTPFTAPDTGNLCFARSEPVRVLLLFSKDLVGVRIGRAFQHANCYGDYRRCEHFRAKADELALAQAAPELEG